MKILIIFETVEGQTRKIADFVARRIETAGHEVRLFNTRDNPPPVSFGGIDKIILAAPVHERRHPKTFEALITACLEELKARPTLMLSVSLKAAFPEGIEEARDYLTEMKLRTGFTPDREGLVAGAVRSSSYSYFESQIVQMVVLIGRTIELGEGVPEFTDWEALGAEVRGFLDAHGVSPDACAGAVLLRQREGLCG